MVEVKEAAAEQFAPAPDARDSPVYLPELLSRLVGRPAWVAAFLFAVALFGADVLLTVRSFPRNGSWTAPLMVLALAFWLGVALAVSVGLWWWRRAPANPTGLLLFAAGAGHGLRLACFCWRYTPWQNLTAVFSSATILALTLVVFGWPTGRPGRRLTTIVAAVVGGSLFLWVVEGLFRRSAVPAEWENPPQAVWDVPQVGYVLNPLHALTLGALPAVVTVVWLIRRRRAVPPAVRPLLTPITVTGVLAAGSIAVELVGLYLFPVDVSTGWDGGWIGMTYYLGEYFLPGFIAIGVLIAGGRRIRAVAAGRRRLRVDLRSATPIVTPSTAAAAITGDPTATVRYLGPDGAWVDGGGFPVGDPAGSRTLIPVVDPAGELLAGVDVDGSRTVPSLLADLAVSTIALRAANERARALADSRRREVGQRSRELVLAADRGRVELERELHDGAQQLLVGLALTAGLRARASGRSADMPTDREYAGEIVRQIHQVRREVLGLVDSSVPAALTLGLAGALSTMVAGYPFDSTLSTDGDLAADDPLALGLYLAAGELLTNAAKHSAATRVGVELIVGHDEVILSVADDGIGGVGQVPDAVADRIGTLRGDARIDSPTGGGTRVRVRAARSRAGAVT